MKSFENFFKKYPLFQYVFSFGSLYIILLVIYLNTYEDAVAGTKVLEVLNIGYFDYGKLFLITLPIVVLGLCLVYRYIKQKKYIKLALVSMLTLFIFVGDTVYNGVVFLDEACPREELPKTGICYISNKITAVYNGGVDYDSINNADPRFQIAPADLDIKTNTSANEESFGFIKAVYTKGDKNYIDMDFITIRHETGDMPWGTIVNDSDDIKTFELSQNVSIKLSNKIVNGIMTTGNYNIGFSEFREIFNSQDDFRSTNPWVVSIKNEVIVEIRENFRS